MKKRVDNVFTYYRGPSDRSTPSDLGRQLEDNATAALLKTITEISHPERDPALAVSLLSTLSGTDIEASGLDLSSRVQVDVSDISAEGRNVYLVGLSPSDLDLSDIDSDVATGVGGIVDGVVEIGDSTVVFEVKTKGDTLDQEQLERYANELGLSPEEYNTATWGKIAEAITQVMSDNNHPVTNFLLDELRELIEFTTLNRTIAAAHWTDDSEIYFNTITLQYEESMNRQTEVSEEDQKPPQIQLQFSADGYKPVSFSPSEWEEAVEQFPDSIRKGFANGDFDPFLKHMEEKGRDTLAKVGADDGVRKIIELNPDKNRITFQSRTSEPNSHYIQRPTINKHDFKRLFSPTETPDTGATPHLIPEGGVAKALFLEGDLEKASLSDNNLSV